MKYVCLSTELDFNSYSKELQFQTTTNKTSMAVYCISFKAKVYRILRIFSSLLHSVIKFQNNLLRVNRNEVSQLSVHLQVVSFNFQLKSATTKRSLSPIYILRGFHNFYGELWTVVVTLYFTLEVVIKPCNKEDDDKNFVLRT